MKNLPLHGLNKETQSQLVTIHFSFKKGTTKPTKYNKPKKTQTCKAKYKQQK